MRIKATSRIWDLLTKQPWTKTGTCALSTDGVRGRQERNPGMDVHGNVSAELALSANFSTGPRFGGGGPFKTQYLSQEVIIWDLHQRKFFLFS